MQLCSTTIFIFALYSTCFEPEGLFSGRRFYVQVWYNLFAYQRYKQSCRWQFSLTKVHVVGLYFTICLCVTKFEVFKTINSSSDYGLL